MELNEKAWKARKRLQAKSRINSMHQRKVVKERAIMTRNITPKLKTAHLKGFFAIVPILISLLIGLR